MVQNCGEGVRIKKFSHDLAIVRSIDIDNYSAFLHYYCTALWFVQAKKSLKIAKQFLFGNAVFGNAIFGS